MSREAIIELFENLAMSQGSYGRLLKYLEELNVCDNDRYEKIMTGLEECGTPLDVIMTIEG